MCYWANEKVRYHDGMQTLASFLFPGIFFVGGKAKENVNNEAFNGYCKFVFHDKRVHPTLVPNCTDVSSICRPMLDYGHGVYISI